MDIESHLILLSLMAGSQHRVDRAAEQALVVRIARQDEEALGLLYDQYARILYSVVFKVVKKPEEAEEVLQEVFLQVWQKAHTFDISRDNVYAWLVTLARNRAIDRIRSRSYRNAQHEVAEPIPELSPSANQETPLEATIMLERAGFIKDALQDIPEEQREVIEMAYFEGYSQSQMSEKLGLPLGTVKTRIRQGMKKLHTILTGRV